jgi:biotin carboxyl carrier protein
MAQDIKPHPELVSQLESESPTAKRDALVDDVVQPVTLGKQLIQFVICCVIMAIGIAAFMIAAASKAEPKKQVRDDGLPTVETVKIMSHEDGLTVDVDGEVVPFREITLTTEVAGRVKSKAPECRPGNYVKEGTLLFEIDPIDYDLEVRRLSQEVRQAEINVKSSDIDIENNLKLIELAEEDVKLQQREVARLVKLLPQGASTQSDVDRAKRADVASRNALEILKNQGRSYVARRASQIAQLDLSGTKLEKAQVDLNRTKILAPIEGVITNELVEVDSFVQRGATLVQIEDTSAVEVTCNLKAEQVYWFWEQAGQGADPNSIASDYDLPRAPAKIICSLGGREYVWQGVLDRYEGMGLNARTRTVPCRILVSNPRGGRSLNENSTSNPPALVRGMFVRVVLQVDSDAKFACIPLAALKPGNEIWRVVDGRLKKSKVHVARMTDDLALLHMDSSMFNLNEDVIISPLPGPVEGMELEISGKDEEATTMSTSSEASSLEGSGTVTKDSDAAPSAG